MGMLQTAISVQWLGVGEKIATFPPFSKVFNKHLGVANGKIRDSLRHRDPS